MGFITEAIDQALWICMKDCAKENNIDNINIRHLLYGDDDRFVINGKLTKPTLKPYGVPNIATVHLRRQINEEIKNRKANAIILGRINYDPFITAEMWFGQVDI